MTVRLLTRYFKKFYKAIKFKVYSDLVFTKNLSSFIWSLVLYKLSK